MRKYTACHSYDYHKRCQKLKGKDCSNLIIVWRAIKTVTVGYLYVYGPSCFISGAPPFATVVFVTLNT